MNQHFFVIGGGELQLDFIKKVKSLGYITHVFDYNPECQGSKLADYFHLISIDDVEGIYKVALEYNPIAVQTVATEMGNVTACAIGERLGLRNNSLDTALNTTDKSRMKKIMNSHQIPTAKSIMLKENFDVSNVRLQFPVVVKASDRSASRGVTFANNFQEFERAYKEAVKVSFNKIVLVEEFLLGKQYSVETISSDGVHHIVAVTEENTDGIPNFVETKHLMPARLSNVEYDKLKTFIFEVLDAFHVKYGAGHIELKYCNGEWKVIEIASRMGGWRDKLVELSMGIDYLKLIIDAAVGNSIRIEKLHNRYAIVRMLTSSIEWNKYLFFKSNYSQYLCDESIKKQNQSKNPDFQAKTLMESDGWYYLVTDSLAKAGYFMED